MPPKHKIESESESSTAGNSTNAEEEEEIFYHVIYETKSWENDESTHTTETIGVYRTLEEANDVVRNYIPDKCEADEWDPGDLDAYHCYPEEDGTLVADVLFPDGEEMKLHIKKRVVPAPAKKVKKKIRGEAKKKPAKPCPPGSKIYIVTILTLEHEKDSKGRLRIVGTFGNKYYANKAAREELEEEGCSKRDYGHGIERELTEEFDSKGLFHGSAEVFQTEKESIRVDVKEMIVK